MKKVLAFDLGNEWTGSALSDTTKTLARPYQTIKAIELHNFLATTLHKEPIDTIVVGHPRTLKGTASQQTLIVEKIFADLQEKFPTYTWLLWDERLSSKRAERLQSGKSKHKKDALKSHAHAAAFILDSYLTFLHAQHLLEIN